MRGGYGNAAPPLVAVAHGSRDPRAAATAAELVDVVRWLRPGLDVRLAFLDLCAPRLGDVLAAVRGCGHGEAVVVPLLLGRAYHATVDLPGAVHAAVARMPRLRVSIADVLGPDPRLSSAALGRLAAAGVALDDPGLGVVLAAAGSSHRPANALVDAVAAGWARHAPWVGARAAFAAATAPSVSGVPEPSGPSGVHGLSVPAAIAALRARGARRIAVASWFLAPGLLPDRVVAAAHATGPDIPVAEPLGADPGVARLVLDRYAAAAADLTRTPRLTEVAASAGH